MLYIATLSEMKSDLGIGDPQDDTRLTAVLEGLQGVFESVLNRGLLRTESVEELFDGGERTLLLYRFPVESITSVHVSEDQEWDADSLLETTDYRLNKDRGRLVLGTDGSTRWPAGVQNVRVVYIGGYVAAGSAVSTGQYAMPEALRRVFRLQAGYEWRNRQHLGQQSVSGQGVSVNLSPAALLPEVKTVLDTFARI